MNTPFSESKYPVEFRQEDAKVLGEHLVHRHCVELVGMKHVGISNFLQFFLYNEQVVKTYMNDSEKHMFIAVNLNDLVEKEIYAFWVLTFKRLVDAVENSNLDFAIKSKISNLFLSSIQSKNFFLTIENLRDCLKIIVEGGYLPTIFFIRFDRVKDIVSEEFLANLQGLRDATAAKLAYVFTSFRSLDDLSPDVFSRKSLSVFSHLMFVKPAKKSDMKIVFETFYKKYNNVPTAQVLDRMISICGGHVNYLQIAVIIFNETVQRSGKDTNLDATFSLLVRDERLRLVSEEIWDSLTEVEKTVVKKIIEGSSVEFDDGELEYLVETGLISKNGEQKVFSLLFEDFVKRHMKSGEGEPFDFTKKENLLYKLLLSNIGDICERETIIETVWPEYADIGVSDWTIDQLIARLRTKLKLQKSPYAVKTVRTRGYRLVEES